MTSCSVSLPVLTSFSTSFGPSSLVSDSRSMSRDGRLFSTAGLDLRLADEHDLQPRELRGEAGVLPAPADRQRHLVVGDDHGRLARLLLVDHVEDARGREGAADEDLRIRAERHDVDPLAAEFLDDVLDARALHSDAGADRIDAVVVADDA